jgi:hypothetical protein
MTSVPFLLVFIAGLGVGVYSMLQGVTPATAAGATTRIGMITGPSVALFAVAFGAIGYLCTTRTSLSHPVILMIALAGGAVTIPLSAPLLAKLARSKYASAEIEIGGQLAKVVQPITEAAAGEISYVHDGNEFRNRALNLVDGTLERGRDVVIDRIEDGVAYVEAWERVEKRL